MATLNGKDIDTANLLNALLSDSKFTFFPFEKPKVEMKKSESTLTKNMLDDINANLNAMRKKQNIVPDVRNIIYNPPATIVTWTDGTKTVVKCDDKDSFSKEFGLAMAYMSKIFGSRCAYKRLIETAYCPQEKRAAAEAKRLENLKRLEKAKASFDEAISTSTTACADGCCESCEVTGYNSRNAFQK